MNIKVVIVLLFSLRYELSCAQDRTNWTEMIIQVPILDEWSVFKIQRQLKCLDGVHLSGYYIPASCLLLKYDPQKVIDPNIIKVILFHLNNKMKNSVINDVSIFEIIDGKNDQIKNRKLK